MSNLKEIKKKIYSIDSVIKTTEAMKMISISELKKYKKFLNHIIIYMDYMKSLFIDLIKLEKRSFLLKKKKIGKKLFILFTSDKGLCGSFNNLIFEKLGKICRVIKEKNFLFFSIGKKGIDFIYEKKLNNYWDYTFSIKKIKIFVKKIINDFYTNKVSSIYLIYHKNIEKNIFIEKLLPIVFNEKKYLKFSINPILESSSKEIFRYFINNFIEIKLKKVFLESILCEHTFRMISMNKATENSYDIKRNLILNYNKERQNTITKEILEIISGLESVKTNN
ncbi:F0F1 ATP synthase subunit gamma [Blattabacterium cuenoti]|uniref:F0F1 ATP synthase subunit gamma n=1 Tax=Blattabacterium cuenoti TaxID=1653831 RepID=UPI00163CEB9C|nr:FoF1 ATP synthase subunit gamma [Blattabacterium cuenoti]